MSEWPYGLTLRPITTWPAGALTRNRKLSQFSAPMRSTLKQLTSELAAIKAKNVVMQIALEETQFRNDGYPRAQAKPEHPGVVLSMETPDGPLSFPCDTFSNWQDNLRAIVLTMEKLRAINRYGVTKHGEQYAGWRAIEAPAPVVAFSSVDDARDFLRRVASRVDVVSPDMELPRLIRAARRASHPDMGGDSDLFQRVGEAERYLASHEQQ